MNSAFQGHDPGPAGHPPSSGGARGAKDSEKVNFGSDDTVRGLSSFTKNNYMALK